MYTNVAPVIKYQHNMYAVASGTTTIWLPNPEITSGEGIIATMVNSGRNANAVVTAQKIGRDQDKTTMEWNYMNKAEWEELVGFLDTNFYFDFTYYSPVARQKITRKCYVSDRKWKPWDIDSNGNPIAYKNCSLSIVDTGEGS